MTSLPKPISTTPTWTAPPFRPLRPGEIGMGILSPPVRHDGHSEHLMGPARSEAGAAAAAATAHPGADRAGAGGEAAGRPLTGRAAGRSRAAAIGILAGERAALRHRGRAGHRHGARGCASGTVAGRSADRRWRRSGAAAPPCGGT
jgi:hypothetical protein